MLHHRLQPTTRRASDEFGPPPAATHQDVLATLPEAASLWVWDALKAGHQVVTQRATWPVDDETAKLLDDMAKRLAGFRP
jgi:hypothetical protein